MACLELYSIAFNQPKMIAEQVRLVSKYVYDDFALTIVDNSSNAAESTAIKNISIGERIRYVR